MKIYASYHNRKVDNRDLIVQILEKELFGIFIRVVVPGQKRRAFGMAIKEAAPHMRQPLENVM